MIMSEYTFNDKNLQKAYEDTLYTLNNIYNNNASDDIKKLEKYLGSLGICRDFSIGTEEKEISVFWKNKEKRIFSCNGKPLIEETYNLRSKIYESGLLCDLVNIIANFYRIK
jgi:hypothetical protein